MKKATMNAIVKYINDNAIEELYEVRDEIVKELNKGEDKAQANRDLYNAAEGVVMDELGKATDGVTIAELYEAVADKLPEGFTKGKLQHGIVKMWADKIVKIEGKVNTYRCKA